ncbi:MAG: hypothetical protein M1818_002273 [Claussenomyces sp. TS43310]|nr:MAG: hypothetical protein M1818_002273 [Claussenomyces sp. TS43310]
MFNNPATPPDPEARIGERSTMLSSDPRHPTTVFKIAVTAKLYIAMYRPRYGNYEHWALILDADDYQTTFEVTGEHGTFERNVLSNNPEQPLRRIQVGTINQRDLPELFKIIQGVEVDNETSEWNCQDYVLEALEKLVDECIVDEDDEDLKKGMKKAKDDHFGPL